MRCRGSVRTGGEQDRRTFHTVLRRSTSLGCGNAPTQGQQLFDQARRRGGPPTGSAEAWWRTRLSSIRRSSSAVPEIAAMKVVEIMRDFRLPSWPTYLPAAGPGISFSRKRPLLALHCPPFADIASNAHDPAFGRQRRGRFPARCGLPSRPQSPWVFAAPLPDRGEDRHGRPR